MSTYFDVILKKLGTRVPLSCDGEAELRLCRRADSASGGWLTFDSSEQTVHVLASCPLQNSTVDVAWLGFSNSQPVRSRCTFGIWRISGTFVFFQNPVGLSNLSIRQKSKKVSSFTSTTCTNSLPEAPQ